MDQVVKRIESKEEVEQYLNKLKYALCNNAKILFQEIRYIDKNRNIRYTNKYTISELFLNENPINVLERELRTLTVKDYIETVKDLKFLKNKR